ncbi:MAG: HAMP domain-containing histidine kinase [Bacteroidia bacterium]|nr:HAMP domain-containing histidine kinase [Bacteroidia bacterium]MCX7652299.1 HAMP domain-containing histidine kinase [Bacteroidia bacterium]MDW8416561.1 HAMP domain-containing sensor histidine kinase [Bacteroidia bacterium]
MRLRWLFLVTSLLLALLVAMTIYARTLSKRLLQQQLNIVHLYAAALRYATQAPEECLKDFFWDYLFPEKQSSPRILIVPLVLTNDKGKVISHNLEELRFSPKGQYISDFLPYLQADTLEFPPINVRFSTGRHWKIYYGEPIILRQIRWMPVVSGGLFIIAGLIWIGFLYTAHRYRQDKLWVGLARETAHQLGTPLSGLVGSIELLRDAPEMLERLLPRMEDDLRRLNEIADRFSKIGAEPRLLPQKLSPILEDIVQYFQKRVPSRVKLTYIPAPQDITLPVNNTLLRWVIENLLRNSLDALPPEGGEITLRVQNRKNEVWIDVEDTGKGIPPTQWEEIFRPGFSTKGHGWGIGLTLARRVVEEYHDGEIFVAQSGLGRGTTIRIRLPIQQRKSIMRKLWKAMLLRMRGIMRLIKR